MPSLFANMYCSVWALYVMEYIGSPEGCVIEEIAQGPCGRMPRLYAVRMQGWYI